MSNGSLFRNTVLFLVASVAPVLADGGFVRLSERAGPYRATVFTSPTPFCAGPVDVSLLLQDAQSDAFVQGADVRLIARSKNLVLRCPLTHASATNKLGYAALFDLPAEGDWHFELDIVGELGPVQLAFAAPAGPPPPAWQALWLWFAWPMPVIAIFLAHQWRMHRRVVVTALAYCGLLGAAREGSADWPQFRGPDGQGHADATGLPTVWSETENIVWKQSIPGRAWSSPVLVGGRIWLTTATDDGHFLRAVCLDAASGKVTHDIEVFAPADPAPINKKNSYASPTPILAGGRLYVHFGSFGTAALDARTGAVLWRNTDLRLDHKEGPGSSPALVGDLLMVNCDGIDVQYVAALDARTGRIRWKHDRPGERDPDPDFRKAYSTPLAIEVDGEIQVISVGADQTIAYEPATGRAIWRVGYKGFSNVPRPVQGHGLVFVCTGYTRPKLLAVRPTGRGDVSNTHVAWQIDRQVPSNPSPILVGDWLFFVSDRGVATCADAISGDVEWTERLGGDYSASPIAAEGRIYFPSEQGVTTVVRASDRFDRLATNELNGAILASPAVAGRAIYLRTETHLYRIEE